MAVDADAVLAGCDLAREAAVDRVVLEQVGESGRIGDVVDGDDLQLRMAFHDGPYQEATDPAEPVDTDLDSHVGLPSKVSFARPGRDNLADYDTQSAASANPRRLRARRGHS